MLSFLKDNILTKPFRKYKMIFSNEIIFYKTRSITRLTYIDDKITIHLKVQNKV